MKSYQINIAVVFAGLALGCSGGGEDESVSTDSDSSGGPANELNPGGQNASGGFPANSGGSGGAPSDGGSAPAGGAENGGGSTGGAGTGGAVGGGGTGGTGEPGVGTCPFLSDADIEAAITSVPSQLPGVAGQSQLEVHYALTKYLFVPALQIHILGTKNVSDWIMVGAYKMSCGIVGTLMDEASREQLINHRVVAITSDDPDVPGTTLEGHKNTGNHIFTIFNQDMVCATAVDTIRPNDEAVWRAWDTPVHEYGHTIEESLDLRATTIEVFSGEPGFDASVQQEYFAWTSQEWFDAGIERSGLDFRASLADHKRTYFASVFSETMVWRPSCAGRP